MKKVFDEQDQKELNPHKGLKFLSALGMALPVFMSTGEQIFAAHVYHEKEIPKQTKVKTVTLINNNWLTVWGKGTGAPDQWGGSWTDSRGVRYYCIDPLLKQPDQGQTQTLEDDYINGDVRAVLRAGYGLNTAAEMGFPGEDARCIQATQLEVWRANGSISDFKIHDAKLGKIDDALRKAAKSKSSYGAGKTNLTIKTWSKDEKTGKASIQVYCTENKEQIHQDDIKISIKGATATFQGQSVKDTVSTGHRIHLQLNKKSDGSFEDAEVTVSSPSYKILTPVYKAAGRQRGVSIVGVEDGKTQATWKFSGSKSPTPHEDLGKIKAMFDLKKKDDEGDNVDQAKFDVYQSDSDWSQGPFIGTITTNKNGVARSGELDPGYYIAIERNTGKNLDIDPTPVHIDLTPDNLQKNAKVTHVKNPNGEAYDLYHLDVDGPINDHKPPLMTSLLTNLEDNSKFAQPIKGPVTLNEHLYFSHLVGTVSYNVRAWLVDKATGQPIIINGQKIEATKTIGSRNNDTNDDGIEDQTDLQLKIPDASSLAGKDVVAFSEISRSDKPDHWTTVHQDVNDKQETIHFSKPSIHTNAINKETEGKKLQPTDRETITDTVTYKELIPGKEYTLKGIVMDKETGKAVMNNGKKVEFTKKFTATNANGRVDAEVTFDAHHYRNHRLVVFESLYYTDYLLTDHRDINDVDQSLDVTNPQLHTTLSDNTQKLVSPKAENTVEDVIRYTDLIPGQTYSVRGKLMDQVTGSAVMKRGVPVMATATFKPNMPNGTVTLTFVFDGTQYVGHHITAFESLYTNGRILVEHADLNDASQTVSVDNKHDNVIPIIPTPTPVIPTPTPGGGGTIINNNNNNNNSSNNGSNNSGNNGSNNSGNNGNNGSNNSGNSGNNESNNSGNNGLHNNGSHNNGNNGSYNAANANNGSHNNGYVARKHVVATKTVLPTNKMVAAPVVASANTVSVARPTKTGHTVVTKEVLPAQSPNTSSSASESTGSSSESLPQTGAKGNPKAQALGAVAVVVSIGSYVYFSRRKQTTGLD